jgi:hypothetical protein
VVVDAIVSYIASKAKGKRQKGSDNRKRNDTPRETIVFVTARQGISVSFLTCHTFKQTHTQHIEKKK